MHLRRDSEARRECIAAMASLWCDSGGRRAGLAVRGRRTAGLRCEWRQAEGEERPGAVPFCPTATCAGEMSFAWSPVSRIAFLSAREWLAELLPRAAIPGDARRARPETT
jgi:hypothetical protein